MNGQADPKDCLDIIITDYQLHVTKARKPKSLGRQIAKAFTSRKPSRAYSNDLELNEKSGALTIDLGLKELQELARKKGKKYIRFLYPKSGVPVLLGKDTTQKFESMIKKGLQKRAKKVYNNR